MFSPLSTETKSTTIANKLEEMILSKQFKAGELLPSQKELALQFNASSRSVREAFKNLEAKGLIQVSQGRKAVVKSNNLDQFVESLSISMISKQAPDKKLTSALPQARPPRGFPGSRELSRDPNRMSVVRQLAKCTSRLQELLPLLEDGMNAEALQQFKQADFDFHSTLIKSNDNMILNSIYENLAPQLYSVLNKTTETFTEMKKKVNEYNYLVEAEEHGQTDLAVALTLVNLTNIKDKIEKLDL